MVLLSGMAENELKLTKTSCVEEVLTVTENCSQASHLANYNNQIITEKKNLVGTTNGQVNAWPKNGQQRLRTSLHVLTNHNDPNGLKI